MPHGLGSGRQPLAKLISASLRAFRAHARALGATEVFGSQICAFPTDEPSSAFEIDYLGRRAFLSQSGLRHHQLLLGTFPAVFEVRPVYWACDSSDGSALTQYTALEVVVSTLGSDLTLSELTLTTVEAVAAGARGTGLTSRSDHSWRQGQDVAWPGAPFPAASGERCVVRDRGEAVAVGIRHTSDPQVDSARLSALGATPEEAAPFVEGAHLAPPAHLSCTLVLEKLLAVLLDSADLRTTTLFARDRATTLP